MPESTSHCVSGTPQAAVVAGPPDMFRDEEPHSSADHRISGAPRFTHQLLQTLREWLHPSKETKLDIIPLLCVSPGHTGQQDTNEEKQSGTAVQRLGDQTLERRAARLRLNPSSLLTSYVAL